MELWIRSQDKDGLYEVDEVYIDERDYGNNDITYYIKTNGVLLGRYSSKERAIEVLDEIQRILHPTVFMSAEINTDDNNWVENGIIYQKYKDNFNIQELSTYVYEMPKE